MQKFALQNLCRKMALVPVLGLLGLAACATGADRKNVYRENDETRPLVDAQYKLSADRQKFSELRSDIPPEVQAKNDELAVINQLFAGSQRNPSDIRNQFDSALRKKRERLQKDLEKERTEFTKTERRDRDEFLKTMEKERKEFLANKHSKDQRDDFFGRQEEKRREYFENQREKRNDFESDATERRRSFEDYAREKQNEFNAEFRVYQRHYDEQLRRNEQRQAQPNVNAGGALSVEAAKAEPVMTKQQLQQKADLQEFESIPKKAGEALESGQ